MSRLVDRLLDRPPAMTREDWWLAVAITVAASGVLFGVIVAVLTGGPR